LRERRSGGESRQSGTASEHQARLYRNGADPKNGAPPGSPERRNNFWKGGGRAR
jgi:hypothetical protein